MRNLLLGLLLATSPSTLPATSQQIDRWFARLRSYGVPDAELADMYNSAMADAQCSPSSLLQCLADAETRWMEKERRRLVLRADMSGGRSTAHLDVSAGPGKPNRKARRKRDKKRRGW